MRMLRILPLLVLMTAAGTAAGNEAKLTAVNESPAGISDEVAARLADGGVRVAGDGETCTVWLAKDVPVMPGFQPTLSVKYPFAPGELIGVLVVPAGAHCKDFRGQELAAGSYLLRYGRQPEDGNHIGTSDLADFLLAIPAKDDTQPAPIGDPDQLSQKSARSVGSQHPAIFSLLPPGEPAAEPKLTHDANQDFWILETTVGSQAGDQKARQPLRLVVIGESAG